MFLTVQAINAVEAEIKKRITAGQSAEVVRDHFAKKPTASE
jgi:hypothetical protein